MKSTTYLRNNKILIVTLLILVSFGFSNKLKSQAPANGKPNVCSSNDSPKANGHYNKHVSDCFDYTKNYAGTAVEGPQDTYNGQTVVTKAALDAFGNLAPNDTAIVKLGNKYFSFVFKSRKLTHIENSLNKDYRYKIFNEDSDKAAIVKQCPLNEDYKIEKALPRLNDWCAAQWTIAKNDIPIPNRTTFKTTCRKINKIYGFPNSIRGIVDDKCVLVGCFKGLKAPVSENSINIDENNGRDALNAKWVNLKDNVNADNKCN